MYASDSNSLRPLLVAAIGLVLFMIGNYYGSGNVVNNASEVVASPLSDTAPPPRQRQHHEELSSVSSTTNNSAAEAHVRVHPSCSREPSSADLKDRPLLIFKYARTGSTWLAWSGETTQLSSKKDMTWVWEAQGCAFHSYDRGAATSEGLVTWLTEYYSKTTNGTIINKNSRKRSARHPDGYNPKCLLTAGRKPDKLGVLAATMNPHPTHDKTPPLSDKDWERIFEAAPNLAIGVLVRTNSVKRTVSAIASDMQVELCGSKKLTGDEDCIRDLPKTINIDTTRLWKGVCDSEMKRVAVPEFAATVAQKYGRKDGRIFCLSYEQMQLDMAGEMEALGHFLGADIDPAGIDKLRRNSVSHKRGSDLLSDYIDNYEEVRESLSSNQCLLEQLEADKPRVFEPCGL